MISKVTPKIQTPTVSDICAALQYSDLLVFKAQQALEAYPKPSHDDFNEVVFDHLQKHLETVLEEREEWLDALAEARCNLWRAK